MEGRPLAQALDQLVEQWKAAGLNAKLSVLGTVRPLSPQTNLTLYRAAQEALTNAAKHARARNVDVNLDFSDHRITHLSVKDDGIGSTNSEGGFGLLGVRERVQLLNGAVHVGTEIGQGFTLHVRVPE